MTIRNIPSEGRLVDTIRRFGGLRVLVIGDAMLDGYLEGFTDRLCREAPVPVVTITRTKLAPGGAANTAANVSSLGARVHFLSVVGGDTDGELLRQSMEEAGVEFDHVILHASRRTLAKRRVLASSQMLVRYDEGTTDPLDAMTEKALVARMRQLWPDCDAIIVSDYGYGILTPAVIQAIENLQQQMPRTLMADSKNLTAYREVGITAAKPNYAEATRLLGVPTIMGTCARADQIAGLQSRLLEITGAQIVAVTLDSEGALVFEKDHPPYRTFADPRPDSRAAGAGDTFMSALALALGAGGDTPEAAEIASAAATIVVNKEETTACSIRELSEYLAAENKFISDPRQLAGQIEQVREHCRRVVFTNGCFDILHRGHIAYLNQAKTLGDVLVVAVNSDASVRRLKGSGRPINSLEDRVSVLSALSCVDHIVSFESDSPEELLGLVRPDVYVKGGDYTRETLPEARLVQELGGTVEILPYIEDRSTSRIIQRIKSSKAGQPSSTERVR